MIGYRDGTLALVCRQCAKPLAVIADADASEEHAVAMVRKHDRDAFCDDRCLDAFGDGPTALKR